MADPNHSHDRHVRLLQQMRHFEALQTKVVQMETRHRMREEQLQQLVERQTAAATVETAGRWRAVVDEKNAEIERFRSELDAILDVLRRLQSQGVVVPYTSLMPTPSGDRT